jgi:LAO/AO transport system kinase
MAMEDRELVSAFRAGNIRALAKSISLVEQRDPSVRWLLEDLGQQIQPPAVLGVTGAPGTGKSTLVDAAIGYLRARGQRVAVIAIDANSPYSGGAILGDRVRMQRQAGDDGVFIRSMGARGHLGGLSLAARETIRLLGAFGFHTVLLETVGVGQSEIEVAGVAETTLVVLTPGLGDGVQMLKAGIMEVADIFVVNKADLPGATRTMQDVRSMLALGPKLEWKPPIVATIAVEGKGLEELFAEISRHRRYLEETGRGIDKASFGLKEETVSLVADWARAQAQRLLDEDGELTQHLLRDRMPYATAEEILNRARAKTDGQ